MKSQLSDSTMRRIKKAVLDHSNIHSASKAARKILFQKENCLFKISVYNELSEIHMSHDPSWSKKPVCFDPNLNTIAKTCFHVVKTRCDIAPKIATCYYFDESNNTWTISHHKPGNCSHSEYIKKEPSDG